MRSSEIERRETTKEDRKKIRQQYNAWRNGEIKICGWAWGKFRRWQFSKQKGRCFYCFIEIVNAPPNYQIDHKQPIYKGGTNDPDNLCIACRECNQYKSYHQLMQTGKARRLARRIDYEQRREVYAMEMKAYMDAMMMLAIDLDDH
jgi:5-methylcytosine-specific restriction endonuclease McrA